MASSLSAPLRELLSAYLFQDEFSDVDFIINDTRIPAHKVILASRSPVFEAMLFELKRDETSTSASGGADHDAVSDERLRVDLGEVDETLFRALLQFCYTDQVDVDVDKVEDLGKLATTYHVEALRQLCSAEHVDVINTSTVWTFLTSDDPKRGNEAQAFLTSKFDKCLKDPAFLAIPVGTLEKALALSNYPPDSVFQHAVLPWARNRAMQTDTENEEEVHAAMREAVDPIWPMLMELIHRLQPATLAATVAPLNWLTPDELLALYMRT